MIAGILGNLGLVGLYVVSRTAGPPMGPRAWVPEAPELLGVLTTAAEFALIVVLVQLLPAAPRRRIVDLVLAAGLTVWALRLAGVL